MEMWRKSERCPGEVWVSSCGNLRTGERITKGFRDGKENIQVKKARLLRPHIHSNGYRVICVKVGGIRKKYLVHRLVAFAFVPNPTKALTVNHINGDKLDNGASNLEWVSLARNTELQWETGLVDVRGEKHPGHKLTEKAVREIRVGGNVMDLAAKYGVCTSLVYMVRRRKKWGWLID